MIAADHVWLLAIALLIDAVVGDPALIWSRVPHPVAAIGALIGALDARLNRTSDPRRLRRAAGVVAIAAVVTVAAGATYVLEWTLRAVPFGWAGTAIVASILLAGRSLYEHVAAVAAPLAMGDLPAARTALGKIVGRDTATLDVSAIARGAIETLAENLSDGVVGPALWFLVLGLPGMAAYKAINTADSMIGHLSERYADFGWAAARLDDLVNLPASRLSGLFIALAASSPRDRANAFRAMLADAPRHASPNAGWPEAAMAGAIGITLGGPRTYDGVAVDGAWLNATGRQTAGVADLRRALRVYLGAAAILVLTVGVAGLALALA